MADVILVKKMLSGARLSRSESKILWNDIFDGVHTHSRIAAILGVLSSRVPNHDEFSAILDVMLERAIEVKLGDEPVLDVCGTGGDGKDTFNISTTTAFVVAGCGVRVAKHGNYGASSKCGSSDVLQALGVPLFSHSDALRECLELTGICFLHAPLFHPALASLAPIRRELGVRTIFNLLGPLANPARPQMQFIGVSDRRYLRVFARSLMERGVKFCLVHGDDGYDEISLTGPTTLLTSTDWGRFLPIEEGFNTVDPDAIAGCVDSAKNATLIESILDGSDRSMRRDVVVANATRALMLAREGSTRDACRKEVEDALDCGKAFGVLNAVRNFVGDCK